MGKYCGSCGAQSGSAQKFCTECGSSIPTQAATSGDADDANLVIEQRHTQTAGSNAAKAKAIDFNGNGLGCLVVVVIVVAILLFGVFRVLALGNDEESPAASQQTQAPASPAPAADSWDNDITRDDCALLSVHVRNLQGLYDGDVFGGSASDLSAAAEDFEQVAAAYSGSDRDWLLKMAELSGQVSGGGEVPAKQLKANLGLFDQFCG
jgi:hypothetical protein